MRSVDVALIHHSLCPCIRMTPAIPGPFCSIMIGGLTSGFNVDEPNEVARAASYQEMARHPEFQLKPLKNDVGIIRLLDPVPIIPDVIDVIPLPPVPGYPSPYIGGFVNVDSYSYASDTYGDLI